MNRRLAPGWLSPSLLLRDRLWPVVAVTTLMAGLVLYACGDDTAAGPGADDGTGDTRVARAVGIRPGSKTLAFLGQTLQLTATAYDVDRFEIDGVTFTWSSSDDGVATVDPTGLVTALASGSTTITATGDGVSGSASITVDTAASIAGECTSCHEAGHVRTPFPASACAACHVPLRDRSATHGTLSDQHSQVSPGFELIGAHAQIRCSSCHNLSSGEPRYSPANQIDCFACHADDYQAQHGGSGYPTTCLTCHSASDWSGASFDHDARYFPIFSGEHSGEWNDCQTCHTVPDDFTRFTCFNCHKHARDKMDDEHENVDGYVYDSPACLACHPQGKD